MIYVDVDDTLVLWQEGLSPNPEAVPRETYFGDPWVLNTRLIEGLKAAAKQEFIVVWSGGGMQYAEMWVDRLGLRNLVMVAEKNFKVVEPGDIVIDDMPVTVRTHNPYEWPEEVTDAL